MKFAECMRANGVPNYPDPSGPDGATPSSKAPASTRTARLSRMPTSYCTKKPGIHTRLQLGVGRRRRYPGRKRPGARSPCGWPGRQRRVGSPTSFQGPPVAEFTAKRVVAVAAIAGALMGGATAGGRGGCGRPNGNSDNTASSSGGDRLGGHRGGGSDHPGDDGAGRRLHRLRGLVHGHRSRPGRRPSR